MIRLNLQLPKASYPIVIGNGALSELRAFIGERNYSSVVVLTDTNVGPQWAAKIHEVFGNKIATITMQAGESYKTLDTLGLIWGDLQRLGTDRKSVLLNIGGGVVTDLGGFAASTYMRGIDFVQVPTTLLSQVDASVGGKTGIDHVGVKNLVGTFTQPKAVCIDTDFLTTLPNRELCSGFAEIIKHGIIADPLSFELASSKPPREFTSEELVKLIHWSCLVKSKLVEADEKESGARKLLNFGHTAGHAVEALSLKTSSPLLHGEAVSIGMMVESQLALRLGRLKGEDLENISKALKTATLPIHYDGKIEMSELWRHMRGDKKSNKGELSWTLPSSIGSAQVDVSAPENMVNDALRSVIPYSV